jgi:hypothetical protein
MKTLYLFALALLLTMTAVHAENVYREPAYSSPTDRVYLYNFPYWIAVNDTEAVYVSNYDTTTSNYAEITLAGGNASNMTYISGTNVFRAYVSSTQEEDVAFNVQIKSSSGTLLATMNDTLRFRIPFTVELLFYKNKNSTSTSEEPYDNEFQYATFYYNPGDTYSYTLEASGSTSWLNKIGRLFPYYKDVGSDNEVRVTDEIYLFGRLNDGVAEITMYENGTYNLHTVNAPIYGGLTAFYEFGRPIANGDIEYNTAVVDNIRVGVESDASYSVFISAWDVYKWNMLMNMGQIILVLVLWGVLVLLISFVTTVWLPNDMRGQAFGVVLGVIATATSPILIMGIRFVW